MDTYCCKPYYSDLYFLGSFGVTLDQWRRNKEVQIVESHFWFLPGTVVNCCFVSTSPNLFINTRKEEMQYRSPIWMSLFYFESNTNVSVFLWMVPVKAPCILFTFGSINDIVKKCESQAGTQERAFMVIILTIHNWVIIDILLML